MRSWFERLRVTPVVPGNSPFDAHGDPADGYLDRLEDWGKKSTVGQLMANLSNHLKMYGDREAVLVAEIADREEELRQVRASKRAVAGAMASLHGDVALTDEEDKKAEAAADAVAMEALGGEINPNAVSTIAEAMKYHGR